MIHRLKGFSELDELNTKKQIKYKALEKINNLLENEKKIDYDTLINSYTKNLIWSENIDYVQFSELDYQMKYIIEENKVALTSILDFANNKFPTPNNFLMDIFKQSNIFSPIHNVWWILAINNNSEFKKQVINKILKTEKWELEILFHNPISNRKITYLIEFNLNSIDWFLNFKNELIDFDIDKIMNEKHVIIKGIWVYK